MCKDQVIIGRPGYEEGTEIIIGEEASIAAAWCAVICAVLGVVGNLVTIVVLIATPLMRRHSTTPYLLSLALSDLIFCGFNLPLTAVRFWNRQWIFDLGYSCIIFTFFFYTNISVSALSMALVAVNRVIGVYVPHMMKFFESYRAWLMVLLVWAFSMGLMLLPLTEVWGQLGYETSTFSCTIMEKNGSSPMKFLLSVGFLVPFVVIAVAYIMICWRVRATGNLVRRIVNRSDSDAVIQYQRKTREKQMTKTVFLVCISYVVCFLPTCLLMVVDPMPPCKGYPGLHVAGYVIFWCSGFINPIIYIFSNRHYLNACKSLFTTKCKPLTSNLTRTSRVSGETSIEMKGMVAVPEQSEDEQ